MALSLRARLGDAWPVRTVVPPWATGSGNGPRRHSSREFSADGDDMVVEDQHSRGNAGRCRDDAGGSLWTSGAARFILIGAGLLVASRSTPPYASTSGGGIARKYRPDYSSDPAAWHIDGRQSTSASLEYVLFPSQPLARACGARL